MNYNITWIKEEELCRVNGAPCTDDFLMQEVGTDLEVTEDENVVVVGDCLYIKEGGVPLKTILESRFGEVRCYQGYFSKDWKVSSYNADRLDATTLYPISKLYETYPSVNVEKAVLLWKAIDESVFPS